MRERVIMSIRFMGCTESADRSISIYKIVQGTPRMRQRERIGLQNGSVLPAPLFFFSFT